MRLFVTGATGFIGSHFVRAALLAGHDVVALRRSDNSQPRIALEGKPVWLTAPLGEVDENAFEGIDAVVHLAAAGVNTQEQNWEELFQANVSDSVKLWIQAARAGVQQFVICGSCFEYGRAAARYEFVPPDAPLEPTSAYGVSKAAASMAAIVLARQYQLQLIIARPFHVFGEGESEHRLWPALRRAALAGEDFDLSPGEQVRDFMPAEDVAVILLANCTSSDTKPGVARILHIGTGRPQTVRQFAESWWAKWNATGRLRFGTQPYRASEVMRYVPLIERNEPARLKT